MTSKEIRKIMIVMVTLIVFVVMSICYIWYSQSVRPLFGRSANSHEEILELEVELQHSKLIIDSLSNIQETAPAFELRRQPPDSLLCKTCPNVENINGVYYELFGSFHTANDARFLAAQLLKVGVHSIKIFRRTGLQAEEILLADTTAALN